MRPSLFLAASLAIACAGSAPSDDPTDPGPITWTLAAFPGAEGFGAGADGGRGGDVLHVTTLSAVGPGSLQAALDAPGPRTIVFDVSGVIDDVVILSHGDVTIAGQTSPDGITVRGLLIQGDVVCEGPSAPDCPLPSTAPEDFIVRDLRVRPAGFDDGDGAGDGVRLHHAANGILDHVSVGNAADEAMQVSFSHDITIQWSLLGETLGEHVEFGGMLVNYSDPARGWPLTRLSVHHTMWNRIFGRLPELSRENVPDDGVMDLELSNNVLWDPERPIYVASANPQDGSPLHYRMNVVSNYTAQDPAMAECYGLMAVEFGPDPERPSFTASSSVFMSGNQHNRLPGATDWQLVYNANDLCAADGAVPWPAGVVPPFAAAERHAFPAITYDEGGDALVGRLAAQAGAFPRDPLDTRLMADAAAGRFSATPPSVNPSDDALDAPTGGAAPTDTDGDGQPDTWERDHGLNPADPADRNGMTLSAAALGVDGYTNLEVYLHERHVEVAGR
jgi:hypothetical protein